MASYNPLTYADHAACVGKPKRSEKSILGTNAKRGKLMKQSIRVAVYHVFVIICFLAAGAAHAGQYTVSYVGTGSYAQDGYSGAGSSSGASASTQISGSITATFTWVPANGNDPAPASAVIVEQCVVHAGGYGYNSPPSASAADGFGDAQTGSPSGNQLYVTSTGFRYSVKSGSTFTATCSPSASAAGTNAVVSVSATYTATAQPVTVYVSGTTGINVGTQQNPIIQPSIMIGQGAGVSIISPALTQIS